MLVCWALCGGPIPYVQHACVCVRSLRGLHCWLLSRWTKGMHGSYCDKVVGLLVVVGGLVDGTEYTPVALQYPALQVIGRSCRLGCPLGGPGPGWVLGETSAGPGPHYFCDSSMAESRSVTGGPTAAALPWLEYSRSEPQGGPWESPESLGEAGRT